MARSFSMRFQLMSLIIYAGLKARSSIQIDIFCMFLLDSKSV